MRQRTQTDTLKNDAYARYYAEEKRKSEEITIKLHKNVP
jgi:hypothetical protein